MTSSFKFYSLEYAFALGLIDEIAVWGGREICPYEPCGLSQV